MVADDGVYAQNWIQLSQRVNVCNTALCACLSKIWCHTMHLFSIVKLESTIFPEFSRAYCDLINETKRNELKIWTSPWCSLRNLHSVRDEIKSSSVFKGRTVPFSHIMQISNLKKDTFREAAAVQFTKCQASVFLVDEKFDCVTWHLPWKISRD